MASIKEVARVAGVSTGTVSNTLNRPELVSRSVRSKVIRVIAELGYVPNESARALRFGRSHEIGMLVTDLTNPFFADVARGADAAADGAGDIVTVSSSGGSAEREVRQLKRLVSQKVKGILVSPLELQDLELNELVGSGIPLVVIGRRPTAATHCSVSIDDVAGGRIAAQHLLSFGHRRIAYIGPFPERLQGIRSAIPSGEEVSVEVFDCPESEPQERARSIGDRLSRLPPADRPTGVICGNDLMALGVLQAMTVAGLRIPQDISIIGFDDIVYASGAAVPLTTIRQPRDTIGRTAVRLLQEEIEDTNHRHQSVVFLPELIQRASTGPLGRDAH